MKLSAGIWKDADAWKLKPPSLIRDDQKRKAKEKLDALLLEGLNSGAPIAGDAKFWTDLKQEALVRRAISK